MTIAYVGAGTLAATSASGAGATFSTIQPSLPTHSTGNLLCALVGIEATDTPITVPAPSGWTQLAKTSGTARQVFLFAKIATSGSETAPIFDPTGEDGTTNPASGNTFLGQCFVFSGSFNLDTVGDLVSASITPAPNAAADATIESGGSGGSTLDVTLDNTLVLWCWHWTNDGNAQTALTNFTVGDTQYTQLGNDGTVGWQYWIQTTATDVTNQQSTITPVTAAETGQNVSLMVSIKETVATYALKLLAHASAASATSIEGVVLNAARDTVIGEFSGQAFEASLEAGKAVLLVPTTSISPDGAALTTSDAPLAVAYNATKSTPLVVCSVVQT